MIFLLNVVPSIIMVALIYLAYRISKVWPLMVAIVFVIVYGLLQPSYMPKGTVKALPNAEFKVENKVIQDRVLKPMSSEDRSARMAEVEELATKRREELIRQIKTEKGVSQ